MSTFLAVCGVILVVLGVFLWSIPAGFVAAGVGCCVIAVGAEISNTPRPPK